MMMEHRFLPLICGFAIILAFIAFLLFPQISELRATQVELQIMEARARVLPVEIVTLDESGNHLHILSKDEFFASLSYIRTAAAGFGLELTALYASVADNFGSNVSETTIRINLAGRFSDVVDYVYYLAGSVYNVRYFSLANTDTAGFDVWLSIFHEG